MIIKNSNFPIFTRFLSKKPIFIKNLNKNSKKTGFTIFTKFCMDVYFIIAQLFNGLHFLNFAPPPWKSRKNFLHKTKIVKKSYLEAKIGKILLDQNCRKSNLTVMKCPKKLRFFNIYLTFWQKTDFFKKSDFGGRFHP